MRKSRSVAVKLLGAAVLSTGCGRPNPPPAPAPALAPAPVQIQHAEPVDWTWHDAAGRPIEERWALDEDWQLAPSPHPCDARGRPWVWDEYGLLVPLALVEPTSTTGALAHSTSGGTTTQPTYHRRTTFVPIIIGSSSSGYRTFSSPAPVGRPSAPGSSTISRGGFGSTGGTTSARS